MFSLKSGKAAKI